jgi:hypothetical protein
MDETRFCTRCGRAVALDDVFCGKCGTNLRPADLQPAMARIVETTNITAGLSRPHSISPARVVASLMMVVTLVAIGYYVVGHRPSAATPTPVVSASELAVASTTPTQATSTTASSVASGQDGDDEPGASAGASFAANATGVLPPDGAPSADRLPGEPDPSLTPGALNPAVTQATIHSTICVSGWTATIRPSESFTNGLKVEQIGQYKYSDTSTSSYEEDHLISLEIGGAPADARNLWPEPYTDSLSDGRPTGAHTKDSFETKLKTEVCAGTMSLVQAQSEIGDHWVHAYYDIALVTSPTSTATTASPTPAFTSSPAALGVRFVSLPDPARLGGVAHLEAQTTAGANCTIVVTWPSGNKSGASGLKTNPTAGDEGIVYWDWNVASTTKPGTAKTKVVCTLDGASAQGTAQFPVH